MNLQKNLLMYSLQFRRDFIKSRAMYTASTYKNLPREMSRYFREPLFTRDFIYRNLFRRPLSLILIDSHALVNLGHRQNALFCEPNVCLSYLYVITQICS